MCSYSNSSTHEQKSIDIAGSGGVFTQMLLDANRGILNKNSIKRNYEYMMRQTPVSFAFTDAFIKGF